MAKLDDVELVVLLILLGNLGLDIGSELVMEVVKWKGKLASELFD